MAFNPFKYTKEFATSGVFRKEAGESISKSWDSHPGNWSLGLGAGSALAFGTGHPYVGGALGIGAGLAGYNHFNSGPVSSAGTSKEISSHLNSVGRGPVSSAGTSKEISSHLNSVGLGIPAQRTVQDMRQEAYGFVNGGGVEPPSRWNEISRPEPVGVRKVSGIPYDVFNTKNAYNGLGLGEAPINTPHVGDW